MITPARFDLLYAIFSAERGGSLHWKHTATQSHVREILGLHTSTVSKMITRLIELGLLVARKDHCRNDRRHRVVSFTPLGLELFARALKLVFDRRELTVQLEDHVSGTIRRPRSRKRWRLHAAIHRLFHTVRGLARRFGDSATGLYTPRRNGTTDRQSPEAAATRRLSKDCGRLIWLKIHAPRPPNPPSERELPDLTYHLPNWLKPPPDWSTN